MPALTRRKIPLMIGGTANAVSVAAAGPALRTSLSLLDGKPIRDNIVNKEVLE